MVAYLFPLYLQHNAISILYAYSRVEYYWASYRDMYIWENASHNYVIYILLSNINTLRLWIVMVMACMKKELHQTFSVFRWSQRGRVTDHVTTTLLQQSVVCECRIRHAQMSNPHCRNCVVTAMIRAIAMGSWVLQAWCRYKRVTELLCLFQSIVQNYLDMPRGMEKWDAGIRNDQIFLSMHNPCIYIK